MRWRRHRALVLSFAVAVVALVALAGGRRVTAVTSSGTGAQAPEGVDFEGTRPFFDDGGVHELRVEYDPRDYRRMIARFRRDGTKTFVDATLTIDGTRIEHVGLRLKGNSTLGGLGGQRGFPGAGGRVRVIGPPPGGGRELGPRGFGPRATAAEPERLPWLIELDHFVAGQRYEGLDRLAVRVGGGATPETALNEALSLELVRAAGEPAEQVAYVSLAVNDRKPALRLVVEEPRKPFVEANFAHGGVLYKSLAMGSFEYRGEDPLAYEDSFRQVTARKQHDLRPLIDLLRWTTNATDAEFAAQLRDHVDVESFARYAALQSLLQNFDDMAGPGANYYLWYDLETKLFTVVTWDMNLALRESFRDMPIEGRRFGRHGGNLLKQRFLESDAFKPLYRRAYRDLRRELFATGRALAELRRLARTIAPADRKTVTAEARALRTILANGVGS